MNIPDWQKGAHLFFRNFPAWFDGSFLCWEYGTTSPPSWVNTPPSDSCSQNNTPYCPIQPIIYPIPWESSRPNKSWLVFRMIHVKDSRSCQFAKLGRLGLPGHIYVVYVPRTQMTLALVAKDLVLEGLRLKIEDK